MKHLEIEGGVNEDNLINLTKLLIERNRKIDLIEKNRQEDLVSDITRLIEKNF
jgi:hypothetical protein